MKNTPFPYRNPLESYRQLRPSPIDTYVVSTPSSAVPQLTPSSSITNSEPTQAQNPRAASLVPRTCRVSKCPNPHCKLISHRLYDRNDWNQPQKPNQQGRSLVVAESDLKIERDGVDGLPRLPFDESLVSELRVLFNHFFTVTFDQLATTFRGPQIIPGFKARMLSVASTNEAYCMGLLSQAQTDIAIRRKRFNETRGGLGIYTKALALSRKHITAIQEHPDPRQIEVALLTLCNLLSYDAIYARNQSLHVHWAGLRHLVELRGGIHSLAVSLPYVLHVDRQVANIVNKPPTYIRPTAPGVQIPMPSWSKYGSGFAELLSRNTQRSCSFQPRVLEYCIATCGLLELHEALESPPEARDTYLRSHISSQFLYYSRDWVDEQFAILHADLFNNDSRDKCILWASRVVEYPVTWRNNVPTFSTYLCAQLSETLSRQDILAVWSDNLDVLIWILFALAVAAQPFQGRNWVVMCL